MDLFAGVGRWSFGEHVHWRRIVKLFGLCGYQMIAEISERVPTLSICRDRSMVIFGRVDNMAPDFVKETVPRMRLVCVREKTLQACAVLDHECSHFLGHSLALSKDQVEIVLDAGLLPIWMRTPGFNLQYLLAVRCVSGQSNLAPIMASYGRNISFQRDYLVKKGLFLQVVQTDQALRLLSPCEIAVAMGFPSGLFLSQDLFEAFQMRDNCFTPIHAAQALTRLARCFHCPFPSEDFPMSASATLNLLLKGCLRAKRKLVCSEGLVRIVNTGFASGRRWVPGPEDPSSPRSPPAASPAAVPPPSMDSLTPATAG